MGSAPVDGGVREVPLEIGLAYHLPIGSRVQLGVRAEVMALSRRMAVPKVTPSSYHRWLFGVRGGGELLVRVVEQFGFALFVGVEANLGATDVVLPIGTSSFSPVRAYGELGPYLRF